MRYSCPCNEHFVIRFLSKIDKVKNCCFGVVHESECVFYRLIIFIWMVLLHCRFLRKQPVLFCEENMTWPEGSSNPTAHKHIQNLQTFCLLKTIFIYDWCTHILIMLIWGHDLTQRDCAYDLKMYGIYFLGLIFSWKLFL